MSALPSVAGLFALLWFGAAPSPPAGVETVRLEPKTRPAVYASPGGRRVDRLADHTPYGSQTRLWVRERRGTWLKVAALNAPGGAGWIAERHTLPAPRLLRRIEIDRSARRLTVINGARRWSTRVIVGGAASPTPLGSFQVTDRLEGRALPRHLREVDLRALGLRHPGPDIAAGRARLPAGRALTAVERRLRPGPGRGAASPLSRSAARHPGADSRLKRVYARD